MDMDQASDILIESEPSEKDLGFLQDQIDQYNIRVTGYDDFQRLAFFLRDGQGQIIAGVSGDV